VLDYHGGEELNGPGNCKISPESVKDSNVPIFVFELISPPTLIITGS
jgi:hypothetical protein